MTDHDQNPFGNALRDRVRDEHPDLDRLVDGSTRAGTRIRRRRQAGATLAAAAAVAAVAVGGQQLLGDDGTTTRGPGFATAPSSATPPDPGQDISEKELAGHLGRLTAIQSQAAERADEVRAQREHLVAVTAEGWTCTDPADAKFDCTNGTDSVHLVWRDAASRPKYLGPDGNGPDSFVSEAHRGIFVTVDPAPGTPAAAATEVGESLVFR